MFRRGVARLLAVVLFLLAPGLVVLPPAMAADAVVENVVSFGDVPESSQFYKEISWLASAGISTGWDVGGGRRAYRPVDSIARDAMAAFLYRRAGSPAFTPPVASPFTDVAPGAAFYKEITWLASKGISTGWDVGGGEREYRPLNPIARDAMAAFLFRFAQPPQFAAPAQSPFVDVSVGGGFYKEITWLASSGISTGWDVGAGKREYRPFNSIGRDAMAAFLYRQASQEVPTDGQEPGAGTVTVAPDVKVLGTTQLDAAQVSSGTVTLPSDKATEIHPNDVLVSGVTTGTPEGLLARVVQVVREPTGNTVVKTKPATLAEAVVSTSGPLKVSGIPAWSNFAPEPDVTTAAPAGSGPMASSMALQAEADVFSQSFSWKRTIKTEIGSSTLSGSGSMSVESSVTAAAKASMTLDTGFLQLKEASVVLTPSFSAEHSLKVSGGLKGTMSAKLGELNSGFTFMVGPVPVVVTTQLKVAANLSVEGEAEISYVSSQTVSSDYGFKYLNGSFNLVNTQPRSAGVQNEVKATASLTTKASLDFDATVKLYGAAGITFGAGPYASAAIAVITSNGTQTWSCPIELGIESRLGIVAGIEIMGFKLGEWTDTTTNTWKLAETNPCEGTPVIAPEPSGTSKPVSITSTSTPDGATGISYQASLTATGGTAPYSWTISSGSLPSGLALERSTGSITGTPTQAGSTTFTARVRDSAGATVSRSLTLAIIDGNAGQPLTNVKSISGGYGNALALKNDGTVYGWGNNNTGQVGDGTTTQRLLPAMISTLNRVTNIAAGSSDGYALKDDGTVWAWGDNSFGEIGDGTTISKPSPVQVPGLAGIKQIYTGSGSAFALANDGTVWGWGYNQAGEIGDGTTTNRLTPVKLALANVRMMAVGDYQSTYALRTDGTVWSWGVNYAGQLGYGTTGLPTTSPAQVHGLSGVVSIDAGSSTAYAVKNDGTVWGWGLGGLGDGTTTNRSLPVQLPGLTGVIEVAAGGYSSAFARRSDGTVWGWGDNTFGQMFDPFTSPRPNYPASGGMRLSPGEIPALAGVSKIDAGGFGSSYALRPDGTAWAWGHNFGGQLGDGTTKTRLGLIQVGVAGSP